MLSRRGAHQAFRRLHRRQQRVVRGRAGRDPRPDRPQRLGQEHHLQHALRHARARTRVRSASRGGRSAGQPPHRIINLGIGRTFQIPRPFRRLSLLDNVVLAGFFGQGRHSRAQAFEAAERALGLVGLPTDRAATVDGLGAAALKKLELAKALATGPQAPARRREPERPRRARDGSGRRPAAPDLPGAAASPSSGSSTSWAS